MIDSNSEEKAYKEAAFLVKNLYKCSIHIKQVDFLNIINYTKQTKNGNLKITQA